MKHWLHNIFSIVFIIFMAMIIIGACLKIDANTPWYIYAIIIGIIISLIFFIQAHTRITTLRKLQEGINIILAECEDELNLWAKEKEKLAESQQKDKDNGE